MSVTRTTRARIALVTSPVWIPAWGFAALFVAAWYGIAATAAALVELFDDMGRTLYWKVYRVARYGHRLDEVRS